MSQRHVSNKMHKAEARAKLSDDKLKEFHKSIRAFGKRMDDAVSHILGEAASCC